MATSFDNVISTYSVHLTADSCESEIAAEMQRIREFLTKPNHTIVEQNYEIYNNGVIIRSYCKFD